MMSRIVTLLTGILLLHITLSAEELALIPNPRSVTYTSTELIAIPEVTQQTVCADSFSRPESYRLAIDAFGARILAADSAGLYYARQTLRQLRETSPQGIRPLVIDDSPRLPRRALMVDPARHFIPVADLKRFVELMARYKFNVLQLHLTDDQGWRLPVEGHPELTAVNPLSGEFYVPAGTSYTRQELEDLVRFAARHHVEIVPEVDIPGHTVSLLAAHPELRCTAADTIDMIPGQTDNRMICAAQDDAYAIIDTVIGTLAAIFPSPYIHLGGDEAAMSRNWQLCDSCRSLMHRLGLEDTRGLMGHFFGRVLPMVRDRGKKAILWCELDNIYYPASEFLFPYPDDVMLVTWRNALTPTCLELTRRSGNQLLMAPGEYAYLDYPQRRGDLPERGNWGMPVTSLAKSYQLDPLYGMSDDSNTNVVGVMGTLWGEAIRDYDRLTYMAFPRALALSEAGWTPMERRDWDSFRQRMLPVLYALMRDGVSFRVPFETVTPQPTDK